MKTTEEIRNELLGLINVKAIGELNPLLCQYTQGSDYFIELLYCSCIKTHKITFDSTNHISKGYNPAVREYCKYHTIKLIKKLESDEPNAEGYKMVLLYLKEIENNENN